MQMKSLLILAVGLAVVLSACGARGTGAGDDAATDPKTATITAEALRQRLQSDEVKPLVVDVREPHEFTQGHIEGARLAPLGRVIEDLGGVEKDREIVLVCRSGNRSGKAQKLLAERGYTSLANMDGGMLAWEKQGYPVVTQP
ncbi:MAG TPA: rhodanese-like domain-containing protein [Thermoanaerobaculia bacterium]|nr:rhodanese-like domain-containing protein [Thermoanaerobaculia bacterium]